jgi:hypothetical protein
VQLTVVLEGGSRFPRTLARGQLGGVGSAQAGPFDVPSAIEEDTKFMDVRQLRTLYRNLDDSRKIQGLLAGFIRYEQQFKYLHEVRDDLNDGNARRAFDAFGGKERVTIERDPAGPAVVERGGDVVVASAADPADVARRVRMTIQRPGQPSTLYEARELVLNARPLNDTNRVDVRVELRDVQIHNGDGSVTPRNAFPYGFNVAMPEAVRAVAEKSFAQYDVNPNLPREQLAALTLTPEQRKLIRELTVLANDIVIESNSRISFAISCLILTFVGCALGMMFRSGNFLSAFAISFIPALVAITLIVAGQARRRHRAVHLPRRREPDPARPGPHLGRQRSPTCWWLPGCGGGAKAVSCS